MIKSTNLDCLVIQTFRTRDVPSWIDRCIKSVQNWASLNQYDYLIFGDEFYELCGEEFLNRGKKNPQAITNLARLIAIRKYLNLGYKRVIWMDADVFIYAPNKLKFDFHDKDLSRGYAFGREVWMTQEGTCLKVPYVHNAAAIFTQDAVDLDMLIDLIKHIDARREIASNLQIGVYLLRGLQNPLMFQTFSNIGLFSPTLLRAILDSNEKILMSYGATYQYPAYAANLCLSLHKKGKNFILTKTKEILGRRNSEKDLSTIMDLLEKTNGMILNQFATKDEAILLPYNHPEI